MAQQTAVEWLVEQIKDKNNQKNLTSKQWNDIVQKALEMDSVQEVHPKSIQVWTDTYEEDIYMIEYDILDYDDKYFELSYSTAREWTEPGAKCCTITDDSENYDIDIDGKKIKINYAQASYLVALLAYVVKDKFRYVVPQEIKTIN